MRKGFTLIELLVVIAVIGMLASIVVVSLKGTREKASLAKAEQFASSVDHVLGAYAVGIWNFDGNAQDRSGYNNHGTVNGAVLTADRNGQANRAYSFNGTSDYINVGSGANLQSFAPPFTISAWVNMQQDKWHYYFGRYLYTADKGGSLGYHSALKKWMIYYRDAAGVYVGRYWGNPVLNQWVHLVVTYDSSLPSANWKTYQNGVAKETFDYVGNPMSYASDTNIGRDPGDTRYWSGFIDDVRIYTQAITTAQVQQLYAEGVLRHQLASAPER